MAPCKNAQVLFCGLSEIPVIATQDLLKKPKVGGLSSCCYITKSGKLRYYCSLWTTFLCQITREFMNALFCLICSYFEGDLSGAKLKDDWYYTSFTLILVCFAIDFAICALSIVGFFTAFSWRPYITEVRSLFACSAMTMLTHSPKSSTRGKWPRPHSRAHLSFGLKLSEPNRFWEEAFH